MIIQITIFGEMGILVLVLGFDVDRRSHILAIPLIRLDPDGVEFVLSSFYRFFESLSTLFGFRGVVLD